MNGIGQKRYWIEDEDCFYSFENEKKRENYLKESNTVLRSQLVPDGLRIFTTKTIYTRTIIKYQIISE